MARLDVLPVLSAQPREAMAYRKPRTSMPFGMTAEAMEMRASFNAHLAVAYHNLGVQLAQGGQLQPASAMIRVADQLACEALAPKHRWARQSHHRGAGTLDQRSPLVSATLTCDPRALWTVCASATKLRDLHVASSFVQHSLRPRRAVEQGGLSRTASRQESGRPAAAHMGATAHMALRESRSLPALMLAHTRINPLDNR